MSDTPQGRGDIHTLLAIMARLRDPDGGCPWDVQQTFSTIAPYTIEEAYEVADAIDRGDLDDLRDELGDLLLQVVFHARMAQEQGAFGFSDVVAAISIPFLAGRDAEYEQLVRATALATADRISMELS